MRLSTITLIDENIVRAFPTFTNVNEHVLLALGSVTPEALELGTPRYKGQNVGSQWCTL